MSKKQASLNLAVESLGASSKMISQIPDGVFDIAKLRSAAGQAEQAARELNQLIGMLEIERGD